MNNQTSYLIMALVIFTTFVIMFNNRKNNDLDTGFYHEAVIVASEIGNSFFNELSQKAFDEKTVSGSIDTVISLTSTKLLGSDAGELTVPNFDDVDDFSGYTKVDTLNKLGLFSTNINVYYVDEDYPEVKSSNRTFHKKIDLEISNLYMPDPIKLFYIVSY